MTIKNQLTTGQETTILNNFKTNRFLYLRARKLLSKIREIKPGQSFLEPNETIEELTGADKETNLTKIISVLFDQAPDTYSEIVKHEEDLVSNSRGAIIHSIDNVEQLEIREGFSPYLADDSIFKSGAKIGIIHSIYNSKGVKIGKFNPSIGTKNDFKTMRESIIKATKAKETKDELLAKVIGQGAFGKVYLGKYQGQEVAVKKLNISFDFLDAKQFTAIKNELDLLKQLVHPNIIKFFTSQQKDSDLLLIMEYADGGSLTDYIKSHENKVYDWKTNYHFMLNMTQGLKYLHQQNIVHRDLKSMNILISNSIAKLADFGISKVRTSQTKTSPHNVIGTVRWMAPEILTENKPHTLRSDIYSLGMIFWELASKKTVPFSDLDEEYISTSIYCRGEREKIPTNTPVILKEIISECWQEKPEQRISLIEIENKLVAVIEIPVNPNY